MNSKILILAALTAILSAACSEKTPDVPANIPNRGTESAPVASPPAGLQITPKSDTPHNVGKFDPTANSLVAEKGQSGVLLYGPYATLALGHYQATFRITAESAVDATEVGSVDVNAFSGATANPPLATAPLKSARGEQAIKLTFDATDLKVSYEFRVFVNGKADRTSVSSVLVEKL